MVILVIVRRRKTDRQKEKIQSVKQNQSITPVRFLEKWSLFRMNQFLMLHPQYLELLLIYAAGGIAPVFAEQSR
ncbi:hypothetical protein ACOJUR_03170 [Alicyclobacillus tolerans]|uniref:Uncharacterized protein n=2 Tax=Alicyclobacillus tolerans TaxID=90970 RepID=A0ABT9LWM0_9BACL|nr:MULTISPECIES: hypothetical protein [Alicyclobacillus]MDP9728571.1 hypothetical protein [Alicyclobacillus tengchongensis]QRF22568.1 hypothetical protein FY534_01875 [Alicyclobacillus sp. TC]SHJ75404.1 hypothetical protein SAMN05443507_10397 [Alicyclobacillus montanus]